MGGISITCAPEVGTHDMQSNIFAMLGQEIIVQMIFELPAAKRGGACLQAECTILQPHLASHAHLFSIAALLQRHLTHTHGVELALLIARKDVSTSRPADSAAPAGKRFDVM